MARDVLYECVLSPYLEDWLLPKCEEQFPKYLNIVMMENSYYIFKKLQLLDNSQLKTLHTKVKQYLQDYAKEIYYYQFDDKFIKSLRAINKHFQKGTSAKIYSNEELFSITK